MILARPWFTPPNWAPGPVWMMLSTLIGIATWLIFRCDHPRCEQASAVFVGHLVANTTWFATFFGPRPPMIGLTIIVVLLAAILAMMREFVAVNRHATALLVPYLLWTCFAAVPSYGFWSLN